MGFFGYVPGCVNPDNVTNSAILELEMHKTVFAVRSPLEKLTSLHGLSSWISGALLGVVEPLLPLWKSLAADLLMG